MIEILIAVVLGLAVLGGTLFAMVVSAHLTYTLWLLVAGL